MKIYLNYFLLFYTATGNSKILKSVAFTFIFYWLFYLFISFVAMSVTFFPNENKV